MQGMAGLRDLYSNWRLRLWKTCATPELLLQPGGALHPILWVQHPKSWTEVRVMGSELGIWDRGIAGHKVDGAEARPCGHHRATVRDGMSHLIVRGHAGPSQWPL